MRGPAEKIQGVFGGFLLKNAHAREARPFSKKTDLHLTFLARPLWGKKSFLHPEKRRAITVILRRQARHEKLRIKDLRFEANRIHLSLWAGQKAALANFLRSVSGLIARRVLSAEKGSPLKDKRNERLWIRRPLSAWLPKTQFFGGSWLEELEGWLAGELGVEGTVGTGPPPARI